jgi:hypothetical protein
VISCGSFTTDGSSNATINLGYEPQWVLIKATEGASDWIILDNMRGFTTGGNDRYLMPQASNGELSYDFGSITSTGFTNKETVGLNKTGIYIAIRRGPMKVPTVGTSVFSPIAVTNSAGTDNTTNFPVDLQINSLRSAGDHFAVDRLRGVSSTATNIGSQLITNSTAAEAGSGSGSITRNWSNTGFQTSDEYGSLSTIYWNFRRAPSFFDVVCYTNNASGASEQVNTHNLGVLPELAITKVRNDVTDWYVGSNIGSTTFDRSFLNTTSAAGNRDYASSSTYKGFTSTTFTVGSSSLVGAAGFNVVTYLFATCAGVSKVGSYTGTGTTKQIDCGFTAGARFVLIKRADDVGDWYVWDSARGIIAGNDPYLLLNSTAAEVTSTDYIDTYSAGFEISSTAPAAINASGGSYIFLAIA